MEVFNLKVLNLYAGIGGNRKLWPDHYQITSVEYHDGICKEYSKLYPDDELINGDALEYLLNNYKKYDFIWASPPCPTHSRARFWGHKDTNPIMPDMTLYQIIIFLKTHYDGKWCVENVVPYYEPLIEPTTKLDRHLFWTNFNITKFEYTPKDKKEFNYKLVEDFAKEYEIYLSPSSKGSRGFDSNKVYRNCVNPLVGKHLIDCAFDKGITLLDYIPGRLI